MRRVLIYSVVLMFVASLAAGVLPAWQATRESLAVSGRRGGRLRLRRGLVVTQVAVAFVVLTTSVLFLRSLIEAGHINPGFDTRQTVQGRRAPAALRAMPIRSAPAPSSTRRCGCSRRCRASGPPRRPTSFR